MKKAAIVRDYLERHPDLGTGELTRLILQENKGMKLHPQEVSKYRSRMRKDKLETVNPVMGTTYSEAHMVVESHSPSVVPSPESLSRNLIRLKEAAQAVGGMEEAKRILDLMGS